MKISTIIGSAITVAVMALVAAFIGSVAAGAQSSVDAGVVTRGIVVVSAIVFAATIWWVRMGRHDVPESLFAGLLLGWALTPTMWTGNGFFAQAFTDITIGRVLVDLALWAVISFAVVALLVRTSARSRAHR